MYQNADSELLACIAPPFKPSTSVSAMQSSIGFGAIPSLREGIALEKPLRGTGSGWFDLP
jgi:hypothetical protein